MPKEKGHYFNIVLDHNNFLRLAKLAEKHNVSKGQIVRWLIERMYAHDIKRAYQCPTGQACYVPQMHMAPQVDKDENGL
jgi:hypothetical protein